MTTLTEEARWAHLRSALEERFTAWEIQAPEVRAAEIVYDLRRSGYRIPLPDHNVRTAPWTAPRKKLDPVKVNSYMAQCRAALRGEDGDQ